MTRAREMSDLLTSGLIPIATYDNGLISSGIAKTLSNDNADGGEISSSSGVSPSSIYSIIIDTDSYNFDGGTI